MPNAEAFEDPTAKTISCIEHEEADRVSSIVAGATRKRVIALERIGGSHNSQVYKVTCSPHETYVAKLYFHHPAHDRRRLDAEYSGLHFMWMDGIRCIPEPIAHDRPNGLGIYEYIQGEKIIAQDAIPSDVDSAINFLVRLKDLRSKANSGNLPTAAEACFSIQAIVNNIQSRLDRLISLEFESSGNDSLQNFLTNEFTTMFEEVTAWCKETAQLTGVDFEALIPLRQRTLSPSDYGFHNTLRRDDSEIVFLDFEYFGWDDPAKMISDFLLHPGSELEGGLKHHFADNIIRAFNEYSNLSSRVRVVYPLFGLKWCLIILNEFLPEHILRRGFVGDIVEGADLLNDCLNRARAMLIKISREYRHFPYYE